MRRRTRIDLGQEASEKEVTRLHKKRQRWDASNPNRPDENPFLNAIRPDQDSYGEPEEQGDELQNRLNNLEYGNFPGYFKYRNKAPVRNESSDSKNEPQKSKCDEEEVSPKQHLDDGLKDERLNLMKREWFEGKNVLDIGCNRGHMTYAIARLFGPKSIVGIDIDLKMIKMANRDLHLHLEEGLLKEARSLRQERVARIQLEGGSTYTEDSYQFPLSSYISQGPLSISGDERECRFPNNLVFVEHNYVLAREELVDKQKAHFDTILCLSVTKWIHLNYRDEGIKRFFKRIYKHLNADGLLVLEAQPFDNYGRRKKLSNRLKANYYSIQFKPEEFDAYLLSDQVGFRRIVFETVTEHECLGFKRPIKVFLK